jgi:hypothetical protein
LFLKEFAGGIVVVVGGPNGRFHIENDRIVLSDKTGIRLAPEATEQSFADDIESIVLTENKKRVN